MLKSFSILVTLLPHRLMKYIEIFLFMMKSEKSIEFEIIHAIQILFDFILSFEKE